MKQRELYPKTLDDPNGPLRDVVYCLDCYGIAVCGPMPSMHYLRSYQSCFQGRTGLTQRRFRPAGILLAPAGISKGLEWKNGGTMVFTMKCNGCGGQGSYTATDLEEATAIAKFFLSKHVMCKPD